MTKDLSSHSEIKLVPLNKLRTSVNTQRVLKPARVELLLSQFDLEQFGLPVVNLRDGAYWIVDGQHRLETLKRWLDKGWENQKIECRAYTGMTEKEEADMFDRLNNQLQVTTFDKFKVRVTAHRQTETAVQRAVEKQGLKISRTKGDGSIQAVATLVRIYERSDTEILGRALRITRDAFGDAGFTSAVLDGIGHLCQRYDGVLNESKSIEQLRAMRGGVGGLTSRAEVLRKQTGNQLSHCVAAAAVDVINRGGGRKLPSWWSDNS